MTILNKVKLSGSTSGEGIMLSTSGGTMIHTTGISSSITDELWLYATNTSSNPIEISFDIGSVANSLYLTLAAKSGLKLVLPGILLSGTGSVGNDVSSYNLSIYNSVYIYGYVNRITP